MTRYEYVKLDREINDPALPLSVHHGRAEFRAPQYDISREGDVLTIGNDEIPFSRVVFARRAPVAEAMTTERLMELATNVPARKGKAK